ncbi:MAG: hypothetical protein ACT4QC_02860 [Planctomycetaceae bacterium]
MRNLLCACLVGAVALTASAASAGSRPMFKLFPKNKFKLASYADPGAPTLGAPALEPTPMPSTPSSPATNGAVPGAQPVPVGEPIELYHCVRYKDECNKAPCAVPMIVTVKDPCAACDPCNACATKCVAVQICVPPCSECPPQVCCRRGGEYVCYDYGKYRVEVTSRNGVVTVDYDD